MDMRERVARELFAIDMKDACTDFISWEDVVKGGAGSEYLEDADRLLSIMGEAKWQRVEDGLPKTDWPVLAAFVNECGRTRVVRAFYAPAFTVESNGEWDEFADYHEENDTYYTPEGWYENNEYDETNWKVACEVTHWMPLPTHPAKLAAMLSSEARNGK